MITPSRHPDPASGPNVAALVAQIAFAAVLLSPVRHYIGPQEKVKQAKNDEDSFPLSTYPMFSADRQGRITIPHVVGFTPTGERVIPHHSHFGLGGLNQVRRQISKALREKRALKVAQTYADALAAQRRRPLPEDPDKARTRAIENQIVEVAAVRSRFIFSQYFADDTSPEAESVHARCLVGGQAVPGPAKALPRLTTSRKARHESAPAHRRHTPAGRSADPSGDDPARGRGLLSGPQHLPATNVRRPAPAES